MGGVARLGDVSRQRRGRGVGLSNLVTCDVRRLIVEQRGQGRRIRLWLGCSPSRMKLWRERTALTIKGTTVSSYPTCRGKWCRPAEFRD
jgi:hypothetical protein